MVAMSPTQARVVDPILTTHSRGYSNPDVERIGRVLAPRAAIAQRGAKIIRFGKESFRLYNTARAPGAKKGRVRLGYTADTISMVQHALSGEVAFEVLQEANKVPGIDLGRRAVNVPMEAIAREEEYNAAVLFTNAANYGSNTEALSGTDRWDDLDDSDPGVQIDDAKAVVRAKIGRDPNVLALGANVYRKLRRNHAVLNHFFPQGTTRPSMVSREQLAEYFDVAKIVVGKDVYMASADVDTAGFTDMWGNVAILAYVPSADGGGDIEVPSFAYTYYLAGNPMVETPWQDRDHDVWVYPVKDEYQVTLTGMDAGYLFTSVIS